MTWPTSRGRLAAAIPLALVLFALAAAFVPNLVNQGVEPDERSTEAQPAAPAPTIILQPPTPSSPSPQASPAPTKSPAATPPPAAPPTVGVGMSTNAPTTDDQSAQQVAVRFVGQILTLGAGDLSPTSRLDRVSSDATPAYLQAARQAAGRRTDRDFEQLRNTGARQRAQVESAVIATRDTDRITIGVLHRLVVEQLGGPAGEATPGPLRTARVVVVRQPDGRWLVDEFGLL